MDKIIVNNISKSYGKVKAVQNLSFKVKEGSIYGVLGPNGAGKTTTIRTLLNIIIPDKGEIFINGEPFKEKTKNIIGYLPEERGLYRKMKVGDVMQFLGELKGLSSSAAIDSAKYWLERVDLLEWIDKKVEELSKGMQQKVQFISSIVHDPEIVIFDEPFAGLDPLNTKLLLDILLELKNRGRTILFSSHILEQAEKIVDDITLIKNGNNILTGQLEKIKDDFSSNLYRIIFEGKVKNIKHLDYVKKINTFGKQLEVEIKNNIKSQEFIKDLVSMNFNIIKYEKVKPSLQNIYLSEMEKKDES